MKLSMVMSTRGRTDEVLHFIDALAALEPGGFELIIVDQNPDGRVRKACSALEPGFPLQVIASPMSKGLSRGRNLGLAKASGEILCFPDDDCTYPPELIAKVLQCFEATGADIVCGRAAAPDGRSINGRFEARAQRVDLQNVFTTQIEWVVFFRRRVFEAIGGYDDAIGVGADTPWQSCEGPELTIRALRGGFSAWYDPEIFAHHPELDTRNPDDAMKDKGRRYARGMGHVLRKHGYGWAYKARYLIRPIGGAGLSLLQGKLNRAAYYLNVALGRAEGYAGRCLGGGAARKARAVVES
ncbi:glycosyltransferase family 2 protein [Variovorax sp. OV329]|uniref:glycosyltransferase family 2 protein n=1 Tax=Variovorax sp. OV329 TaxID=1882825 RepID=UPI0015877793|nr:glycosyltransferase [Variovorax sp. OV329]